MAHGDDIDIKRRSREKEQKDVMGKAELQLGSMSLKEKMMYLEPIKVLVWPNRKNINFLAWVRPCLVQNPDEMQIHGLIIINAHSHHTPQLTQLHKPKAH
ncbi:uncharacterized protein G2W53_023496 [Senna tora]|uniref:Uncharacterized protein n=1 Tax=Senna tora TaxID=362788 RepID=A0A834TBJ7_9FABA|nr:uncharacterized protein G2W53_023496 [Senna tora]